MGAFSFATGFFDKLNADRDLNQQNDLATQRQLMNVWASTTLPMIQKNRAEDTAAVARMNDYMGIETFQKSPELAFIASKAVGRGEYKDANDFLAAYEKDSTIVPPEVRQKQLDALNKSFEYDTDATSGKVTNFRFRKQADNSAPLPGANQDNSLAGAFFGKKKPIDVANDARTTFKGMTGEDPTDPNALGSRFNSVPTSGSVDIKPIDTRKQKYQDMQAQFVMQNADKLKNLPSMMKAFQEGPEAILKEAGKPGAFYTREDLQSQEFQQGLKQTFIKAALDGDFNDTNGAIAAIVKGNFNPATLAKDLKSPEAKAQEAAKAASIKGLLNPNGDMDWIALMSQPEKFALVVPDEKDRKTISQNFKLYMSNKLMTDQVRTMGALGGAGAAALVQKPDAGFSFGGSSEQPSPAPAATEQPASTAPPAEAPAGGKPTRLPGAFGFDPEFKPEPNKNARLGESAIDGTVDRASVPLATAIKTEDLSAIEKANPFAVLKGLSYATVKDPEKIVRAMRFTDNDVAKLNTQQFRKEYDFDKVAKYMPSYKDPMTAVKEAPVGSVVKVNGQYIVMTQAVKDALTTQYGK